MLSTVKKIGPVLDLFSAEQPEWKLGDIARALGMPKSSAHALVATLAEVGLLSMGEKGRYRLGWNLVSLAERVRASLNFTEHALPAMRRLAFETHETVLLAVLDRHDVIYVERADGNHPMVRLAGVHPGARVPAHATAVGKVLLAARSASEVESLMSGTSWKVFTGRTINSFDGLSAELDRVRQAGHAFDRGEVVPDVRCCACSVRDLHGSVVAAMSVSMPAYRFPDDPAALLDRLKATAEQVSISLAAATQQRAAAEPEPEAAAAH